MTPKYPRIWIAAHGGPVGAACAVDAPPAILRLLARDADMFVRMNVGVNPNAPVDVLRYLAGDVNNNVLEAVAGNTNTPPDVLRMFAKAEGRGNARLREYVAMNPNATADVLDILSKDDSGGVLFEVAKNPNTPRAARERLANISKSVRERAASHGRVGIEHHARAWLRADDPDWRERLILAGGASTSEEVVRYLTKDAAPDVRNAAVKELRRRGLEP